ncbi:right-handed parallel beta-helix repeat-containing protein [Coraliomargarita sp. SDUM461004]|uniref:Right-handed parallel beta-helix repeat-containing protein n=1 Tax=Thalassobacterium sedimentorum TaxID=3041258 RepID=A0ABU1AE62_9BACT|nr:right-handed parallel beta-helix repeat-containing protein [Coraliomargarita sp. SDUM461004]MDQ8192914.1 right-handed parallel beta-helix repeat-containing protein [Coraliomargarita sp. SDUM461004]
MNIVLYKKKSQWALISEFSSEQYAESESIEMLWPLVEEMLAGGGLLRISADELEISRPISLGSNTYLEGSGTATRVVPSPTFVGEALIVMASANASSVRNLSLHGLGRVSYGVMLCDSVDCRVAEVTASCCVDAGIVCRDNSSCCTLSNCTAIENQRANFLFENLAFAGRLGNFPPNTVTACTSIGGGHGFEVHQATVFNITASTAFQSRGHGFKVHQTSNSVLISGCRTFQCEQSAVYVENAHELNVSSNVFCWQRSDGIVLNNVNWAAINANEVIDSGVRDLKERRRVGILLHSDTKGVQIVGNTIFNWGDQPPMSHAIYEAADCSENLFVNNHINYVADVPVVSLGQHSVVGENMIVAEAAYRNMDKSPFPDFDRDAIERYAQLKYQ